MIDVDEDDDDDDMETIGLLPQSSKLRARKNISGQAKVR